MHLKIMVDLRNVKFYKHMHVDPMSCTITFEGERGHLGSIKLVVGLGDVLVNYIIYKELLAWGLAISG